jgi:hypothetical protein
MALPDLRTRGVRRSDVAPVRRPCFVDLVDGEEARRSLIGGSDLAEKLIPHGAKCVTAFGHLGHVDVRIEVIENIEIRLRRVTRGVDAQKVDRVGRDQSGPSLCDAAVQQRPGHPEALATFVSVVRVGRQYSENGEA